MQAKRDATVQFRPGYFSPDPKKEQRPRARMEDAVFSNQTLREIPTVVAVPTAPEKDGSFPVSVAFTVDVNPLLFTTAEDRHYQQLAFVAALLDKQGGLVTGKESIMDLALTSERLTSLQRNRPQGGLDAHRARRFLSVTHREGRLEGSPGGIHYAPRIESKIALVVSGSSSGPSHLGN